MALSLDGILFAIGLIIIYKKKAVQSILDWRFNSESAKFLLKQSWPLILSAVMVSLYMQIDIVMLKPLGAKVVGIYSAAARISEAWYFIPVAIVIEN